MVKRISVCHAKQVVSAVSYQCFMAAFKATLIGAVLDCMRGCTVMVANA